MDRLREIENRCKEATPEEWVVEIHSDLEEAQKDGGFEWTGGPYDPFGGPVGAVYKKEPERGGVSGLPGCIEASAADARFIACSRQDIPYLLKRLRESEERVRQIVDSALETWGPDSSEWECDCAVCEGIRRMEARK